MVCRRQAMSTKQLALVIDLNVCVGCHACVTSCKQWNTSGSAGPPEPGRSGRSAPSSRRPASACGIERCRSFVLLYDGWSRRHEQQAENEVGIAQRPTGQHIRGMVGVQHDPADADRQYDECTHYEEPAPLRVVHGRERDGKQRRQRVERGVGPIGGEVTS